MDTHSAKFEYDSKGRATDVWKLQKTTTSPWTYVQTHTTYGADSTPIWGAATEVVEDYGSGKINRTTQTLAYDSIGRATQVQDAAGHQFETTYDLDGKIESIDRIDVTPNVNMVSYTYGSTANNIINGQVTQIVDGLSGVTQDFSYNGASNGGATGQVALITETNGSASYSTAYTYTDQGDRDVATYTTPNGTSRWKYSDYISVGSPDSPKRAFQTLNRMNSTPASTAEEFHYSYDSSGRIINAAFAQTPQTGGSAPTSAPFYTAAYPAATRARAYYTYEPGGRLTSLQHGWETWGHSDYGTWTPILANDRVYDSVKGLTYQSKFYSRNTGTGGWQLDRTEQFGYDAELDYLTSAEYGDSLTNHSTTWTYDAAGNRATDSAQTGSWAYDNLNRMTSANGTTCTNDILGNQLTKGSSRTMTWDVLNRLTGRSGTNSGTSFTYRADGMRVAKAVSATTPISMPYAANFYYDGQMRFEDDEAHPVGNTNVRRKGSDEVERRTGSNVR